MVAHPEILRIGSFSIRWYGLMVASGLLAGYLLMLRRAKRHNHTTDDVSDICFWSVIGALLGARALYVIRFWEDFSGNLLEIPCFWHGGLVFLGGFAGAVLGVWLLCRRNHWPIPETADFIAPSILLGEGFGRIGCLLNGCCYGFPYDGPCAISYPAGPLHPTFPLQGISSLAAFLGCGMLLFVEKKGWMKRRLFLLYLILYCLGRFTLEFLRGDYPPAQRTWGLTPAQITCLWLLPLSIGVYTFFAISRRPAK